METDSLCNSHEFQTHQRNTVKSQTKSKRKVKTNKQSKMTNMQHLSFSEFDTDGDKQISKEEFNALRRERIQKQTEEGRALQNRSAFASYDKNKDGVLSEEEFVAYPESKNTEK